MPDEVFGAYLDSRVNEDKQALPFSADGCLHYDRHRFLPLAGRFHFHWQRIKVSSQYPVILPVELGLYCEVLLITEDGT